MSYRISFSAGAAAAELWAFGEDDLAQAALDCPTSSCWRRGVQQWCTTTSSIPLPVTGRRITNGHVMAFATMNVLEGGVRPLARLRRRPEKEMPEHIRLAKASYGPFLETHRLLGDLA